MNILTAEQLINKPERLNPQQVGSIARALTEHAGIIVIQREIPRPLSEGHEQNPPVPQNPTVKTGH